MEIRRKVTQKLFLILALFAVSLYGLFSHFNKIQVASMSFGENQSYEERTTTHASVSSPVNKRLLEIRNIVFVKTHKTGGTTMANIMFRFGIARNLLIGLGRTGRGSVIVLAETCTTT